MNLTRATWFLTLAILVVQSTPAQQVVSDESKLETDRNTEVKRRRSTSRLVDYMKMLDSKIDAIKMIFKTQLGDAYGKIASLGESLSAMEEALEARGVEGMELLETDIYDLKQHLKDVAAKVHVCEAGDPFCEDEIPLSQYGKLVFRNERYSGFTSTYLLKNVNYYPNVLTGPGFANLSKPNKGAWIDKDFIANWNENMKKDKVKVRFAFWKRDSTGAKPVVDIIFNGTDSDVTNWFKKERVLHVVHGPNVTKKTSFNMWSFAGHVDAKRHFFVNLYFNGCRGDKGMIVVDEVFEVCRRHWAGAKGWKAYPRFLYTKNPNGCRWSAASCVKEADVFTISVL